MNPEGRVVPKLTGRVQLRGERKGLPRRRCPAPGRPGTESESLERVTGKNRVIPGPFGGWFQHLYLPGYYSSPILHQSFLSTLAKVTYVFNSSWILNEKEL